MGGFHKAGTGWAVDGKSASPKSYNSPRVVDVCMLAMTAGRLYVLFHHFTKSISSGFYFRWRRSSSGVEMDGGKRILEFIAIMRKDNCQWAIPGVIYYF